MKDVVLPSGEPVTVMGYVPAGGEALVVMVRVLAQVGLQGLLEKEAVAPLGRPEAVRVTGWVVPASRVRVMVVEAALPATTEMGPELLRL